MNDVIDFLKDYIWKNGFEKLSEDPFAVYKAIVKPGKGKQEIEPKRARLVLVTLMSKTHEMARKGSSADEIVSHIQSEHCLNKKAAKDIASVYLELFNDENKKSWIVHAIYTGAPFDYKTKSVGDVRKVKLLKCNGGVIIDGIPFAFEKSQHSVSLNVDLFDEEVFPKKNVAERIAETISTEVKAQLLDIQDLFAKSKNIFLSDNDIKLAKKYISECDKRINEVLVKAQNTQELL